MYTVNIKLKNNINYNINIGFNILNNIKLFKDIEKNNKILIVTNNLLKNIYLKSLILILKKIFYNIDYIIIPDGEKAKS
ncbi:hypothetical protein [Candidatus Nardonella dryophthoridicola]|uniref:3-dehydroquinate synthase n=1 Tax=endosymbiont of Metamasius hemipterus TaxID=204627 RepID=A0ABT0TWG2_9GAMM|nr:hypothetical protein [Candidatus Nardonella dryophthoridicola]MCM0158333.1 hypothetical protein [endosymbiont of Metamasius hemipterus]